MEIKFRAWDKFEKRMGEVNYIKYSNVQYTQISARFKKKEKIVDEWFNYGCEDGSDNIILMQYTGECIPDCGEMIYDGDILEQSYVSPLDGETIINRYLVCFENGCYIVKNIGHSPYGDTFLYFILNTHDGHFIVKIIGNKFDNSELLEVEE